MGKNTPYFLRFPSDVNRELKIETFSERRQLQPDVTSSFVGYCACSCSPPCRRGPVGDVKLVCLALWRKREYLTFISIRFVAFSNQHFADYRSQIVLVFFEAHSSSISKLCYLNLHLWMFLCFHSQGQDPTWQTANRKWAWHGQNFPMSQTKVSRQKIWTPIFQLCIFSSLFSLEYRINETHWKLYRIVGNTMY